MHHASIHLSTQQRSATLAAIVGRPVLSAIAGDLTRKADLALEVPDRIHFRNLVEPVVEPAAPSSQFAALIGCLNRSMSGYAWSTINAIMEAVDRGPIVAGTADRAEKAAACRSTATAAWWNVDGGSLHVNREDRSRALAKCESVEKLLAASPLLGLCDTGRTLNQAKRLSNRRRWEAVASANHAVFMRAAPGLPSDRGRHQVALVVRGDLIPGGGAGCIEDLAGQRVTTGASDALQLEWIAAGVGDYFVAAMYAPAGDDILIAQAIEQIADLAAGRRVVVGGDFNARGMSGGRPDASKYLKIEQLERQTRMRALRGPGADFVATWPATTTGVVVESTAPKRQPVQLDHVLVDPARTTGRITVQPLVGSDHLPIVAKAWTH